MIGVTSLIFVYHMSHDRRVRRGDDWSHHGAILGRLSDPYRRDDLNLGLNTEE